MSKPSGTDYSTLNWVKKELDETLRHAAEALEAHAEDPSDVTQLQFCGTHLHQVYGILHMLELFGAAMLVEEMEQVVDALVAERVSTRQEAYEVLMRAILQLSDYLERIQGGLQDIPILILPLLNDLRAARGANLLTENALFAPDLAAMASAPRRARLGGENLAQRARRLRHRYQLGLLGFLRDQEVKASLQRMLEALDELDEASEDDLVGTVWWVAAGLVEALGRDAGHGSAAVKMLLGQVDRQIKRAADGGEASLALEPPRELIKNLLYYVARAETVGERVPAIQAQYGLKDLLLDENELEQARQGMSGPNSEILGTVADAIKEDLTTVKDNLDLYSRAGAVDSERLAPVVEVLRRVGDTLGVLGLGVPRSVVKEQTGLVEAMLHEGRLPDEAQLMAIAESLLFVESALDGLTRRRPGDSGAWLFTPESGQQGDRARSELELSEIEFKHIYGSAIQEAVADVGRIKDVIVKFIEGGLGEELGELDDRFASVGGALRLLDLDRAALLLQAAGRYVAEHLRPGLAAPDAESLDALADAITSIEYYLEAVREGHLSPGPILEVAASGLERLGYLPADAAAPAEPAFDGAPSLVELEPVEAALPVEAPEPQPRIDPPEAAAPAEPVAPVVRKSSRVDYAVAPLADEIDADILEIFIEEADEVLETLRSEYPRWRANPDDAEVLATLRRMFHTLKGSGRLAGALLLGELSWSQESLLNRILDHTLAADSEAFGIVGDALEALPSLLDNIRGGPAPGPEIQSIMRRAELLADPSRRDELAALEAVPAETVAVEAVPAEEPTGDEEIVLEGAPAWGEPEQAADAGSELSALDFTAGIDADAADATAEPLEIEPLAVAEPAQEPAEVLLIAAEPVMDPVLYDIFSRETSDHLSVVREYVATARAGGLASAVTDPLVRALHTLTGSARMAGVDTIARVGRKLEAYSEHHLAEERAFFERDLGLLERGVDLIERLLDSLPDAAAFEPEVDALLASVDAAAAELPAAEPAVDSAGAEAAPVPDSLSAGGEAAEDGAAGASEAVDEAAEGAVDDAAGESAADALPASADAVGDAGEPRLAAADGIGSDLVELFLEEAEDILGFVDTSVQRWEDEPDDAASVAELHRSLHTLKGGARLAGFHGIGNLCHALEGLSGDVVDHKVPADDRFFNVLRASLDRLARMVEEGRRGLPANQPNDLLATIAELRGRAGGAAPAAPDLRGGEDNELIEVFLEEASEILEAQEQALHSWQEQPGSLDLITELQRALHTLKGGARMAGFGPIGNLSHAFETLLLGVQSQRTAVTPALFDLLERLQDRLFGMRETAARGEPLAEAADLIAEVVAMREGCGSYAAEPSAATAEEPVAGQPIVTPPPVRDVAALIAAATAAQTEPEQPHRDDGRAQHDQVRVRADLLDNLVNFAGEVSIYRARLDQQVGAMRFNLTEFDQTVTRLREQLRTLEIETEAQMVYRFEREQEYTGADANEEFDPLEFDRFSRMQELSRALSESVNDLVSIQNLLDYLSREAETLLLQQSRVNTELQDGLMRTRMVPFANLVPRMRRIVRQTCQELGKHAQFKVLGAQGEMDRTVLERVTPPLEHMLRNAVAHGIESPEQRTRAGKPADGTITVALAREGADVVIRVTDDGGGMKLDAIRRKAVQMGLMPENAPLGDREVMQFILEAGFSTAEEVTQIAGRGVGMDVVAAEIKQLGGTLEIDSTTGQGSLFTVRLPFTLAINQALLCQAGEDVYAIPLTSIEGIARMSHEELARCFAAPYRAHFQYADARYEVKALSQLLGVGEPVLPGAGKRSPVILVHTGDHRLALQVDNLLGNREIVVKSVGPQVSSVPGIHGATILADGRVVLILDVSSLVRLGITAQLSAEPAAPAAPAPAPSEMGGGVTVMVVDDSITMRKVATRLLERSGMQVVTAKDGVDAVARLQEVLPNAMLLDIEMPRMDGYELATHMRNDARLKDVPIIMITSRTGEKHRQRAMEIGVNRYLGKPYQESDLLENLRQVLDEQAERR